ncbi:hypothetical protein A4V01_13100 [Erysipelotrichaceae bacterium I46]|nr:hypothetical protein A4V01_13100 [Erysipelotrichaceae bacterium I46]ASU17749.1 hypothetical protein ADH65_04155 [[Clostridium] innocuum]WAK79411.1 hypothetical protein [Clostridium phage Amboise]
MKNKKEEARRKLNARVKTINLNYQRRNPDSLLNEMLKIKLNRFESYIIKKLVQRSVKRGRKKNR